MQAELEESLGRLQSFCGPGGRAQLGCNVQTISYTNGPRDKKVFKHLNQFILQAAARCGKLEGRMSWCNVIRMDRFFVQIGQIESEVV